MFNYFINLYMDILYCALDHVTSVVLFRYLSARVYVFYCTFQMFFLTLTKLMFGLSILMSLVADWWGPAGTKVFVSTVD